MQLHLSSSIAWSLLIQIVAAVPNAAPANAFAIAASTLEIANSFTSETPSSAVPSATNASSSSTTSRSSSMSSIPQLTGEFTGADGGVYGVTSQAGAVYVAGHALTAGGPGALVGNEPVTEASGGFVAGGQTIQLLSVTATPSVSTTMFVPTLVSAAPTSAASTAGAGGGATSSSSAMAAEVVTAAVGAPMGVVMGCVLGWLIL